MACRLRLETIETVSPELLRSQAHGFSDLRLGILLNTAAGEVRQKRKAHQIVPVYKRVDTCAAEFESYTPYLYSAYEQECEAAPSEKRRL